MENVQGKKATKKAKEKKTKCEYDFYMIGN